MYHHKNRGQSAQGFLPPPLHIVKYTPKTFECLLLFSQFFRRCTDALVGPIFTFNTSYDVVLRKVVLFGGDKIGYNSACIRDIREMFASNRGFSG